MSPVQWTADCIVINVWQENFQEFGDFVKRQFPSLELEVFKQQEQIVKL